jgi:hypothetical protein
VTEKIATPTETTTPEPPEPTEPRETRANWIGVPAFFNLNQACAVLNAAFGWGSTFLVGSSLERRDFRDVDVRTMLDDEVFDRLFPGGGNQNCAYWSLICSSISLYLAQHSGLPVDFQIQRRTEANRQYKGRRHAVGIFIGPIDERAVPKKPEDT